MTQRELNRAVASATCESVATIERLGFGLADPDDVNFDPEPNERPPQLIDWDEIYPADLPRRVHRQEPAMA